MHLVKKSGKKEGDLPLPDNNSGEKPMFDEEEKQNEIIENIVDGGNLGNSDLDTQLLQDDNVVKNEEIHQDDDKKLGADSEILDFGNEKKEEVIHGKNQIDLTKSEINFFENLESNLNQNKNVQSEGSLFSSMAGEELEQTIAELKKNNNQNQDNPVNQLDPSYIPPVEDLDSLLETLTEEFLKNSNDH
jgi:hypothetical protein